MTWDELKTFIDAELAKKGLDGSIEIWYFDFSPHSGAPVSVSATKENGLAVS